MLGVELEVELEDNTIDYELPSSHEAGCCLVLQAGNFDAPNDIMDRMFLRNQVHQVCDMT